MKFLEDEVKNILNVAAKIKGWSTKADTQSLSRWSSQSLSQRL